MKGRRNLTILTALLAGLRIAQQRPQFPDVVLTSWYIPRYLVGLGTYLGTSRVSNLPRFRVGTILGYLGRGRYNRAYPALATDIIGTY